MDIAITGSIAQDYLMRFPGKFAEHILPEKIDKLSVSFLVDNMSRHFGGIAANIAYSLGLLGQQPRPRLVGTVGRDFGEYRVWLEAAGVDTSPVRQINDVFTASFFANTDEVNNQIAFFYAGAMAYAKDYSLQDVLPSPPDLVVVAPNDPTAMQQYVAECAAEGHRLMYDPSQQVARLDGDTLKQGIEACHILICNDYEFEVIGKKTAWTLQNITGVVPVLIITRGAEGSDVYTEGRQIHAPVFPPQQIIDPTGVGDAFRSGLLRGMAEGWPWELCMRMGALAATYVLEHVGTQSHRYTPAEFVARFRAQFDDGGVLDTLLD